MNIFRHLFTFAALLSLFACQQDKSSSSSSSSKFANIQGDYVTSGYAQRTNSADWSVVTIIPLSDKEAQITIRSRADLKEPSCTFKGKATLMQSNVLRCESNGKVLLFTVTDNQLQVKTEQESDQSFLSEFCSGDATIAQSYIKTTAPLDSRQLTKSDFAKQLNWKNLTFNLFAKKTTPIGDLTIEVPALSEGHQTRTTPYKGTITDAQLVDLDKDSSPELIVFLDSGKPNKGTSVKVFSVIEDQTMKEIEFPNLWSNPDFGDNYMGRNTFSIVDDALVLTFPVFDDNLNLTDQQKEVRYKMIRSGEGKVFEVGEIK